MSALPPIATKLRTSREVRFVPRGDSCTAAKLHAIRSPRRRGEQRLRYMVKPSVFAVLRLIISSYFGRPPRYPITRRSAVRELIPAVPCGLIIVRPAISEAVPDTSVEVLRGNDAGHAAASARRRYLSGRTGSVGCGCCGERGSDHCHNGQCGFHWFPPKCQKRKLLEAALASLTERP